MARPEYEHPALRVGAPTAADIHRGSFIRKYADDGGSLGFEWTFQLWFRDKDGETIGLLDPARRQYLVALPLQQGMPAIDAVVAAAKAELVAQGFSLV